MVPLSVIATETLDLTRVGKLASDQAREACLHWAKKIEGSCTPSLGPLDSHSQFMVGVWMCVFITAGPIIKLCAGGEGDSEGHVL